MKSKNVIKNKQALLKNLEKLYRRMEDSYSDIATRIGLTCDGCEDNCCVSYFQHHTHIEWAYMYQGIYTLEEKKQQEIYNRSIEYVNLLDKTLQEGKQPKIMCPLNEDGRCILYKYRLMICRLHGVPNIVKMPNGVLKKFTGCIRCIQLTQNAQFFPIMDRTPFYISLVELERKYTKLLKNPLQKVDHTIAQMILLGEPK